MIINLFDVQAEHFTAIELEDVLDIVLAEVNAGKESLVIHHREAELNMDQRSLNDAGIEDNDSFIISRKTVVSHSQARQQHRTAISKQAEEARRYILANEQVRQQLLQKERNLVEAAESDPLLFEELLRKKRDQLSEIEESLMHTMEHHPEAFASVAMLYVPVRVNDTEIKAFVDCGAQATISNIRMLCSFVVSERCAEQCGITNMIDRRFAGVARGVGSGKFLGKVHTIQLKFGQLFLPCSVLVLADTEVDGPDMLLGLDMLRRHQSVIDLGRNVLILGGESVAFLPENS